LIIKSINLIKKDKLKMQSKIPYKELLNLQQLKAVFYIDTPLLVLAGAGSGKTRVITYKIAYLINELGVKPDNILAVTFTNKASGEMKERINDLLGKNLDIWIKTFHGASAKILRTMGNYFGVKKGFSIIDQKDQISSVKDIIKKLNIDPDIYKPVKYVNLINRSKNMLLNCNKAKLGNFSNDLLFYEIYQIYEDKLEKENMLDFGDLILKVAAGLKNNISALSILKNKFQYILIDEFQDTNHAQYELIKRLTLPARNNLLKEGTLPQAKICVVGDDDQSIYGFRGAQIENILNFPNDYNNTKIIKLEENYRSCQNILNASSCVINNNPSRMAKTLWTKKGEGRKLEFYRTPSEYDEARFIVRKIIDLVTNNEYRHSDIAVFYRMNAQSRVFESVFSSVHIPYVIVGGLRFYERGEIKDIIAYLKLAMNPLDEISLRRIISKPPRGIGDKTTEEIVNGSIKRGISLFDMDIDSDLKVSNARKKTVTKFIEFIKELGKMINSSYPPDIINWLYKESGYLAWLKDEGKDEKTRNLEELYNAVEEFSKKNPLSGITEFVEEVSLDMGGINNQSVNNGVFLITLHNAKGLEFPVVFMAGMEDGIFPHYLSEDRINDREEERRLCYVGMTRAKERLFLTCAKVRKLYGRSIERAISNFVLEIPKDLIIYKDEMMDSLNFLNPYIEKNKGSFAFNKSNINKEIIKLEKDDRVIHKKFGEGSVLNTENETAVIQFDNGNTMKFMLRYTPLIKE